jgi:hypothetical protein
MGLLLLPDPPHLLWAGSPLQRDLVTILRNTVFPSLQICRYVCTYL